MRKMDPLAGPRQASFLGRPLPRLHDDLVLVPSCCCMDHKLLAYFRSPWGLRHNDDTIIRYFSIRSTLPVQLYIRGTSFPFNYYFIMLLVTHLEFHRQSPGFSTKI